MIAMWCKFPKGVYQVPEVIGNPLALKLLVFLCDKCDHDPQEVDGILVNRGQYLTTLSLLKATFTPEQKTLNPLHKALEALKKADILETKGVFLRRSSKDNQMRYSNEIIKKAQSRDNQKVKNKVNQKTLLTLLFIEDYDLDESESRDNQKSESRDNQKEGKKRQSLEIINRDNIKETIKKETKKESKTSTPTPLKKSDEERHELLQDPSLSDFDREVLRQNLEQEERVKRKNEDGIQVRNHWLELKRITGSQIEPIDPTNERQSFALFRALDYYGLENTLKAVDRIFGDSRQFLEITNQQGRPFSPDWLLSKIPEILSGRYQDRPTSPTFESREDKKERENRESMERIRKILDYRPPEE